jgi:hypothetical protein
MGLPFETPGGYDDDLTTPDYDGYGQDPSGSYQDPAGEDDFFEDDYDLEEDPYEEPGQGERAGWDADTGTTSGTDQM